MAYEKKDRWFNKKDAVEFISTTDVFSIIEYVKKGYTALEIHYILGQKYEWVIIRDYVRRLENRKRLEY